jgi:glycosyltransferase involved in cell wall biosynthesis
MQRRSARELGEWSDVVVGQLTARGFSLRLGARCRRPVAYFMHIGNVDERALFGSPDLTVFASTTVQQQYPWITPSIVVRPPVPEDEYLSTQGDAITLVTYSEAKGARVFTELARRLPERQFLTIAAGTERPPPAPNVTVLGPVEDMRAVYGRTRILLMPSVYESYGRVGLEAAASGIPTIAHPAAGIREALGDAAVFVDRDDVDAWAGAICRLDEPAEYARRSTLARVRFESLDAARELDTLEARLRALASTRVEVR